MNTFNIKIYNILKNDLRLSDGKAQEFVHALDEIVQADIKNSATEFKSVVKEDFLKLEMSTKIESNRLDIKIEQTKSDLLKWFIGLFIALALMIIGLYIK